MRLNLWPGYTARVFDLIVDSYTALVYSYDSKRVQSKNAIMTRIRVVDRLASQMIVKLGTPDVCVLASEYPPRAG